MFLLFRRARTHTHTPAAPLPCVCVCVRACLPAISRAPSLLDSVPPASRPTKPTFSFFWSAGAPGNTPPFRDFCTMMETRPAPTRRSTDSPEIQRRGRPGPASASLLRNRGREREEEEKTRRRRGQQDGGEEEAKRRKRGEQDGGEAEEKRRRRGEQDGADPLISSFFSQRLPAQKGSRVTSSTVIDQHDRLKRKSQ